MTTKLHPWQEKIFVDLESGGVRPGEMMVMMAGRQIGKSTFSAMYNRIMADLQNQPVEELVLSENKLAGARYYCVEPVGGNWKNMEVWCTQTFGEPGEVWPKQEFVWPEVPRWVQNNRKFWFRSEKDRDWFIIKWNA